MEISVSIVAAAWRRFGPRRPVERPGTPRGDRGGEGERQPLPVVELQGREHREGDDRQRQDRRDDQAPAGVVGTSWSWASIVVAAVGGVVAA